MHLTGKNKSLNENEKNEISKISLDTRNIEIIC